MKRMLLFKYFAFCLSSGICFCPPSFAADDALFTTRSDDPKLQNALSAGIQFEENHDNMKALVEFNKAIQLCPNDWRAHFHKALCLNRMNLPKGAQSDILKAIELSPHSSEPKILLATVQTGLRQYDAAVNTLKNVLDQFPDDKRTFSTKVSLVENLARLDRIDEACEVAKEALSDHSKTPKEMFRLAGMLSCAGRLDMEAVVLRKFCSLFPDDPKVLDALATADRSERDYFDGKNPSNSIFVKAWALSMKRRMPLKVFIIAEPGMDPDLLETSRNAFGEWQRMAPIISFEYVSSSDNADIVFEWTSKKDKTKVKNADMTPVSAECFKRNRKDGEGQQKWIISGLAPKSQLEYRIRSIHEIGHALGLTHSLEPDDVMCGFRSFHGLPQGLSRNDIKRVNDLYSEPAKPAEPVRQKDTDSLSSNSLLNFETVVAKAGIVKIYAV